MLYVRFLHINGSQVLDTRTSASPVPVGDRAHTMCCVVGAGPAGAVLALLLARQNVPVVLCEARGDFDRDFRGDAVHPAILQVLDEIGLADRLLAHVPHRKLRSVALPTEPPARIDLGELRTRFPYMTLMPQTDFLEFITAEAARYPAFTLHMGASVRELLTDGGVVRGVRLRQSGEHRELRALLTVGADGRHSQVRRQSGLRAITYGSAIDVLWFRLPRLPDDPEGIVARVGRGHMMLLVDRGERWQIGSVIPKGSFARMRAAGLGDLRDTIATLVPWLAERVDHLVEWTQVALLSVQSDRLARWWRPGLLIIGDAAHVMSPVAGNGINYAIQDAVAAANILTGPLSNGVVTDRDLAAVERRRGWVTRVTQFGVAQAQDRGLTRVLRNDVSPPSPAVLHALLRIPVLGTLPARLALLGLRPEHIDPGLRTAVAQPDT